MRRKRWIVKYSPINTLEGIPIELFFHILDFLTKIGFPDYRDLFLFEEWQFEIIKNLMQVSWKIRELTTIYLKKKCGLFELFSKPDLYQNNYLPIKQTLQLEKLREPKKNVELLRIFIDILRKIIPKDIQEKIKLFGFTIANLYIKGSEFKMKTLMETLNKIIDENIELPFGQLKIYIPRKCWDYRKFTNSIAYMISIFRQYSGINIYIYIIRNKESGREVWTFQLELAKINIVFYTDNVDLYLMRTFTCELLLTNLNLDEIYLDTLDNRIEESQIIFSIENKYLEPIVLHINPTNQFINMGIFKYFGDFSVAGINNWKICSEIKNYKKK